jgi:lysozyme
MNPTNTYDYPALSAELSRDENRVAFVYPDSLGYLTIGGGHLVDKRKGGSIKDSVIDLIFQLDVQGVERNLDRALPWWRNLDGVRQRELLNMCFNMGIGNAQTGEGVLGFVNTLRAVQNGDYLTASQGMLKSKWAGQVGNRAIRLANMMRTGTV